MKVADVDNSHLTRVRNLQNQVNDLTKNVSRGSVALRDPSGAHVLSMINGPGPTLLAQGHDAGMKFADGQVTATRADGATPAPFNSGDITSGSVDSSAGWSIVRNGVVPTHMSANENIGMAAYDSTLYLVDKDMNTNAASVRLWANNVVAPTLNSNQISTGGITTNGMTCNAQINLAGNIAMGFNSIFCGDIHAQTVYGHVIPEVQGPVGPVGPQGPQGIQGPQGPPSERALKHDEGELEDPLGVIRAIRTGRYTWRDPESTPGADLLEHDGLYVDELDEIAPRSVIQSEDGYRRPDERALIAHLIAAVQQLTDRVEQLETQLAS